MTRPADLEIHVTRVRNDDCYGHLTEHCDPSGCAGIEHYYPELYARADGVKKGDVVCWTPAYEGQAGSVEVQS